MVTKGKIVETGIMGMFRKLPNDDLIQYLPQPDYLDVGKFKLQKSLRGVKLVGSQVDDQSRGFQLYKDSYETLLRVSTLCF